ncbi:ThuA domain-containing protein [Akkermansiaceae bacterium]|nr:ThuA domain-containing protein [Akkermansiaceae bacterium]
MDASDIAKRVGFEFTRKFRNVLLGGSLTASLFAQQPHYQFETSASTGENAPRPREFLYFSQQNNSHHSPLNFMAELRRPFGERGIRFESSIQIPDLNESNLDRFDGVFFFGNHNTLSTGAQTAVLNFTNNGGGIVGMHVAAYSFRNLPAMRELLGGAFLGHHAIQEFTPQLIQNSGNLPSNLAANPRHPAFPAGETYPFNPNHPIIQGLGTYTSFDEPYLHQFMNQDIVLLSYRADHGGFDEPYTWVRSPGSGRVFYHANGHDTRTWSKANFRELMIRGTDWTSESLQAGVSTYSDFSQPMITSDGKVQFLANTSKDGVDTSALYSAGAQSIRSGTSAPGHDEQYLPILSSGTQHTRSAGGLNAITCNLDQGANLNIVPAIFVGPSNYPYLVARGEGNADSIEGGFTFSQNQDFPFQSNSTGDVTFHAKIEDTAGGNQKNALVITSGPIITPLAIEGASVSSQPAITIENLPDDSALFALSDEGELTSAATLNDGNSSSLGIIHGSEGNLSACIPTSGLPVNSNLESFHSISQIHSQQISFSAKLIGNGIDSTNDQILAQISTSGTLSLLSREGDIIPASPSPVTLSFPAGEQQAYHFGNRSVARAQTPDGSQSYILVCPLGQDPRIIGREGSQISAENKQWTISHLDFNQFAASPSSLLIGATLELVSDSAVTRQALLHQRIGALRVIMMEGWTITGGSPLLVSGLEITGGPAGRSSLNKNEQAVFIATAADSSEKLVLIQNLDDIDQNGVPDTIESAFGPVSSDGSDPRPEGFPSLTPDSLGGTNISYWHNITLGNTISYIPQMSHDLLEWFPIQGAFEANPDQTGVSAGFEKRNLTIPIDNTSTFFRFKLE